MKQEENQYQPCYLNNKITIIIMNSMKQDGNLTVFYKYF